MNGTDSPQMDEASRLKTLRGYALLDTPPEPGWDDLAALAAQICDTPIALIVLVDERRLWFKSRVGVELVEGAREFSFCLHTLLHDEVFMVPDALEDARFDQNPLVHGEFGIRFYAGARLLAPNGAALGTLCVMDKVPRDLRPEQQQALQALSRQVIAQLELRAHTKELAKSERLLQTIFDSVPECVKLLDPDGSIKMMNRAGLAMVEAEGFEQVAGRSMCDFVLPRHQENIMNLMGQVFHGASVSGEFQITGLKGTVRWLETHAAPMVEDGDSTGLLAITHDITARKLADEALHALMKENADLRAALDEHSLVARTDAAGKIFFVNDKFCAISQYSREELLGQDHRILNSGYHSREFMAHLWETIQSGKVWHGEIKNRAKDGSCFWLDTTIFPFLNEDGNPKQYVAIRTNITERKKAEEARLASESRYRTLFEYAPDGILIADESTRLLDANQSVCRMLGYSREELMGMKAEDIIGTSDHEVIAPALDCINAHQDFHRELLFRRKDGSEFRGDVISTKMPDGNILGMVRDITERRRIEARFRRLVDSNAQGVCFWNRSGKITGANHAFLEMAGYSQDDLAAGEIDWKAMTPPEFADRDRLSLEELERRGAASPYEKDIIRKDGSRIPVLLGAALFEDSPEEGVCFVIDLTERKQLEQQFLRAQRIESIGTLAGGIAHDLNNSLSPIIMSLELLKMRYPDTASQELLSLVKSCAERGAGMVQQVLSFARGVKVERMEMQVRHLIQDIVKVINETFLKHIQVETIVPRDLWTVLGDPTQIHQVLLNLCVNARDAMPHGGKLTISAENITLDAQYSGFAGDAKPGNYVFLQIEDNGTGIPADILDKIFDPFFTTKEVGKGTGLGLSTSLAIIKGHGGFIRVYSEVGKGTMFKVYLPAKGANVPSSIARPLPEIPRGNGELILVADDEVAVRQITQETLEEFGYRAVTAGDGAEAVAIYAAHQGAVAAVITDMMMPIMDGPACIGALLKLDPGVRIIATSGLSAHGHPANSGGDCVKYFLAKPYTAETLLKTLRQVLEE